MKKRSLLVSAVLVLFCALIMAGCSDKKPEEPKAVSDSVYSEMRNDLTQKGSIKPGANVEQYVDENGNMGIKYTNPDGSGGGGVVID